MGNRARKSSRARGIAGNRGQAGNSGCPAGKVGGLTDSERNSVAGVFFKDARELFPTVVSGLACAGSFGPLVHEVKLADAAWAR